MTWGMPHLRTTILPTCPSEPGTTTKSAGWIGAHPHNAAATSRSAAAVRKGLFLGRFVHLDDEFGSTHAHDGRRRADLHRLRRLLHHLAGHRGEAALAQVAFELAR